MDVGWLEMVRWTLPKAHGQIIPYSVFRYANATRVRLVAAGYVIVCALMRMMSEMGMTVDRAVRRFAEGRPPGIYKDGGWPRGALARTTVRLAHRVISVEGWGQGGVPGWEGAPARRDMAKAAITIYMIGDVTPFGVGGAWSRARPDSGR
eukprot:364638-Chlamydomonas_euryale.AAC.4